WRWVTMEWPDDRRNDAEISPRVRLKLDLQTLAMKLIALGTAGYHPTERRQTACFLLPELGTVLDAGTGIFRLREHLATPQLDIYLTHAHLDHVAGLTFLLDVFNGKPMERVTIHALPDKLEAVDKHLLDELIFPVK